MEIITRKTPEHNAFVNLCNMSLEKKGFQCEPSSDPMFDLAVTMDSGHRLFVRVEAISGLFTYGDPHLRELAESAEEEFYFYFFSNVFGDRWIAYMEPSSNFLPAFRLLDSFEERILSGAEPWPADGTGQVDEALPEEETSLEERAQENEVLLDALLEEQSPQEGEALLGTRASQPSELDRGSIAEAWVEEYLKERVRVELEYDCIVESPLDPQFDLYVIPRPGSDEFFVPFHVFIVPVLDKKRYGSVDDQVSRALSKIKLADKDENFLIYEFDVKLGLGSSYFRRSSKYLDRLLSSNDWIDPRS